MTRNEKQEMMERIANNKAEYMDRIIPVLSKTVGEGVIFFEYEELGGILESYRLVYDDDTSLVFTEEVIKFLDMVWDYEFDPISLHTIAMYNLVRNDDSTMISPLIKLIEEMSGVEMPVDEEFANKLVVVTNKRRIFGANRILLKKTLRALYQRFKGPYYILPSSIHEVICCSCEVDPDGLSAIVREVNMTTVEEPDLLSDRVFISDGKKVRLVDE